MKFLIVALFVIGAANASVIPVAGQIEQDIIPGIASETLVQGPSTKTRLLGPDGSQIAADAPGGRIVTNEAVPVVALPVVATNAIVAEPVIAVAAPVVAEPVIPVVAEPVVTVAKATLETVAAEAVAAKTADEEAPVIVTETVVSSDDSEGQYVPDNNEKLYDDGSYKEVATEEALDDESDKQ